MHDEGELRVEVILMASMVEVQQPAGFLRGDDEIIKIIIESQDIDMEA